MESIQLLITLGPDGVVNVNGPIGNKVLCYGLLESAKDAIRNFKAGDAPRVIVPELQDLKRF